MALGLLEALHGRAGHVHGDAGIDRQRLDRVQADDVRARPPGQGRDRRHQPAGRFGRRQRDKDGLDGHSGSPFQGPAAAPVLSAQHAPGPAAWP